MLVVLGVCRLGLFITLSSNQRVLRKRKDVSGRLKYQYSLGVHQKIAQFISDLMIICLIATVVTELITKLVVKVGLT